MVQAKKEHRIVSGPSKFDLMVGLFTQEKPVIFKTAEGEMFEVMILSAGKIGHRDENWEINGFFLKNAFNFESDDVLDRKCRVEFSTGTRQGTLEVTGGRKHTIRCLSRFSDEALKKEIVLCESLAQETRKSLDEYIAGLNPHQQLTVKARLAQKLMEANVHTEMEHEAFLLTQRPKEKK